MNSPSLTGMGLDYEAKISPKKARQYAGMYPLPRLGYEILIARTLGNNVLKLGNVSGAYVLFSHTTPKCAWRDVFGLSENF